MDEVGLWDIRDFPYWATTLIGHSYTICGFGLYLQLPSLSPASVRQ